MLSISTIIVSQYLNSSIIFLNPALSVRHIAKYVKRRNERCHGKNGALSRVTRPHARVHTPPSASSTLVVDLQDKYYSEKLDYRYRPPPNVDSCASVDRSELPTRAWRARERVWKTFGAITTISSTPASNLALFSNTRQTAIPHEFFVYLNRTRGTTSLWP